MSLGINSFFDHMWAKGGDYAPGIYIHDILRMTKLRWEGWVPGYRDGVRLIPISPEGFKTQIVTLQEGQEARVIFKSRVPYEEPRKGQAQITVQSVEDLPDAQSVWVVVYSRATLLEDQGDTSGADWDIITVLANPCEGQVPMNPETLLANHYGLSGGTRTQMTSKEFENKLRESVLWWKDKAMATLPKEFPNA